MATITGTAGDDTMTGANSADWYFGLDGNDSIFGGNGNDTLEGGLGADTLDGGAGIDWVSYRNSTSGVAVHLDPGQEWFGEAQGDILISIENIQGSAFGDNLQGDNANNVIEGGAGSDVMAGWGGIDTVSYVNAASSIAVDLTASSGSLGEAAGDHIYDFENVIGSRFADTIVGTAGDNVLQGRAGADYLDAGAGIDWASYENSGNAVTANLTTGLGTRGEANGDTLIGFENLRGGTRADILTGDTGNNVIAGGAGADTLDGGDGVDWASYQFSTGAVTASLATGAGTQGDANGDVLSNFENLRGGAGADRLTGDANGNVLEGKGGRDTLDGGAGFDWASYETATAGVVANMATATGTSGEAQNDVYSNVEGLRGSMFDDRLVGNAFDNWFDGWLGGADTFDGAGGSDWVSYETADAATAVNMGAGHHTQFATGDLFINIENVRGSRAADALVGDMGNNILEGGAGADYLDGAGGIDTASYQGAASGVSADLGRPSADGSAHGTGSRGDAAGDFLNNFENLIGSAFDDVLFGNSGDNSLTGGAGPDIFGFRDGTGTDTVTDFAVAGPGKDTLDVSLVSGINGLSDLTLTQVGADTQIGLAGQGTVVLLNTLVTDIDASHFVF